MTHRKSGPARVVFVPGLGLDERSSVRVRAELARVPDGGAPVRSDVVLLPGMGRRGPVPALDVLAAMLRDALGEGPVVLVGHSQGCQVAAAAATDPRVAALVLLGPTTDPGLRHAAGLAGRWLATAVTEPWWQLPGILAQWSRTGPRAMLSLWRRAAPDRTDGRLRRLRAPVTVVRGTRDRLCPRTWAERLVAAAPRGRLVELAGAAHMTVQTHPRALAGIVRGEAQGAGRSREGGAPVLDRGHRPAYFVDPTD